MLFNWIRVRGCLCLVGSSEISIETVGESLKLVVLYTDVKIKLDRLSHEYGSAEFSSEMTNSNESKRIRLF